MRVAPVHNFNPVVHFLQISNRGFEVQYSDSLLPLLWQPLALPANAPGFSAVTFTNFIADTTATNAARYYRVRVFEP